MTSPSPAMRDAPSSAAGGAERENDPAVLELLVELAGALHKCGIYPDGHPLLHAAVSVIVARLDVLLRVKEVLAIGVAHSQLVVHGEPVGPGNIFLRELAEKLHRRDIGAVRFLRGADVRELTGALTALAREESSSEWREQASVQWPHVQVVPLSYDRLGLGYGDPSDSSAEAESEGWAVQLWQRLARATLGDATRDAEAVTEPTALARAIERDAADAGLAARVVDFLGRLTAAARAHGAWTLGARAAEMIRALTPAALSRLLALGADPAKRREVVRDASHSLPAKAVLDLAQAAASASSHTMSDALLLLLAKLARHAEEGDRPRRLPADDAVRINVRQLVEDWGDASVLPDEGYWDMLERLTAEPSVAGNALGTFDVPPAEIVRLSVVADLFGPSGRQAVAEMVRRGQIAELAAIVDAAPESSQVCRTLHRYLDNTRTIRRLLQDRPMDLVVLRRLVARVGVGAAEPLLDALATEEGGETKRQLFEMLALLGPGAASAVVAHLPRTPTHVQPLLLSLMARWPEWPTSFDALGYLRHADVRVRREAFALVLGPHPAIRTKLRGEAIAEGVGDTDEGIVRAALGAALEQGCPVKAASVLAHRLESRTLVGRTAVEAIRVLATVRLPIVPRALARLTIERRRWTLRHRLAPKSPALLAAIGVLAERFAHEPDTALVLALAARHKDAEIRAAARRDGKAVA